MNYSFRKVTTESSTGSTGSNRIRTTLTIRVEDVDFDTQACMLRVKGRNIQENQYVKVCNLKILFVLSFCFKYIDFNCFFLLYIIRWVHIILLIWSSIANLLLLNHVGIALL